MINYDQADVQSMALCVWKESRGEGQFGMQAVAWVIRNRAQDWYYGNPGSLHQTVYAKNQFTSMSVPSDPEFNLAPPDGDPQYAYCLGICPDVLRGTVSDPTGGAHYYCNPAEATSGWFAENIVADASNHPRTAAIGKQLFYK